MVDRASHPQWRPWWTVAIVHRGQRATPTKDQGRQAHPHCLRPWVAHPHRPVPGRQGQPPYVSERVAPVGPVVNGKIVPVYAGAKCAGVCGVVNRMAIPAWRTPPRAEKAPLPIPHLGYEHSEALFVRCVVRAGLWQKRSRIGLGHCSYPYRPVRVADKRTERHS